MEIYEYTLRLTHEVYDYDNDSNEHIKHNEPLYYRYSSIRSLTPDELRTVIEYAASLLKETLGVWYD